MRKRYIHYGARAFDDQQFVPISNVFLSNKPNGGLWASPVSAKQPWSKWCKRSMGVECKTDEYFKFQLTKCANVIHLFCYDDVMRLPMQENKEIESLNLSLLKSNAYPDFEKLKNQGVDAIEYHLSEDTSTDWFLNLYQALYGWDCDSILILNPKIIEII